jgi:hypothetical protein
MMNWSALTKKQQQMVIGTAVLAVLQFVLMAHFLGWTKPASARGGSARKELLELEQKIATARTVVVQKETILKNMEAGIAKLESLAMNAPASSDRYAWAYEYVSRCAAQAQVSLDSLEETSGPEAGIDEQSYAIRVSARCGYTDLVKLLWRLEKSNSLLRIKEVTLASVEGVQQSHQARILMDWPAIVKIERGIQ